jgi:hypothetical protein
MSVFLILNNLDSIVSSTDRSKWIGIISPSKAGKQKEKEEKIVINNPLRFLILLLGL